MFHTKGGTSPPLSMGYDPTERVPTKTKVTLEPSDPELGPSSTDSWEISQGLNWLVVDPSEKYESIGMIIINIWKNKGHVPNHQSNKMI